MTTDKSKEQRESLRSPQVPEPYHRWAANEDPDVRAFSMKDRCLSCGVKRHSFTTLSGGLQNNAVAAGPCPQKPWRELTDGQIAALVSAYEEDKS